MKLTSVQLSSRVGIKVLPVHNTDTSQSPKYWKLLNFCIYKHTVYMYVYNMCMYNVLVEKVRVRRKKEMRRGGGESNMYIVHVHT